MRKITSLVPLLFLITLELNAQFSFMTFNLRYDNPGDKENQWNYRKDELASMVMHYHPDILGIQEGLNSQVLFLDSALTNYDYAGVGRDDGKSKGEYSAIFYNTERFRLLSTKTFWLSETPEKVSVGWDAAMERIVTFGSFVSKEGKDTIYVFNCHMDHVGKTAREKSAELILQLITEMKLWNQKIILMGDFNAEPQDAPILLLSGKLDCAYNKPGVTSRGPEGTFNGFKTNEPVSKRIDYIFTKNLQVSEYRHIDERRKNNLWLSDHLPVMIKIR